MVAVHWQVSDPLWARGGLMKVAEGAQLLERLEVEAQGAPSPGTVTMPSGLTPDVGGVANIEANKC